MFYAHSIFYLSFFQLNSLLIEQVNVGGTNNVVNACLSSGVPRLIYASTTDVIWCDQWMNKEGDESMPYLRDEDVNRKAFYERL